VDATSFQTLTQWAAGRLAQGDPARTVSRVSIDSRALKAGDLFVALRGENFDGHSFVRKAAELGAAGAVVDANFAEELPAGFAVIRVPDTLAALQAIATAYRASLPLRAVGITGSSGKTSTKDFAAAVLGEKFRVVKTEGNFNNHIGLPLTLLRASSADEVGIFEMGMNHPGEIAPLVAMAAPQVGIITNIGTAHIEFMGSQQAIAQEKGILAEALPSNGTLVLNVSDGSSEAIARRSAARVIMVGIDLGELCGTVLETGFEGSRFLVESRVVENGEWQVRDKAEVYLPVPGVHMIENALLAIGVGLALGVPLKAAATGLAQCTLTKGRLELKSVRGIRILDDTYNANPDSMRAAVRTLRAMPVTGARIAVLGCMGELGTESANGHRCVGAAVAEARLDLLIAVGPQAGLIAEAARQAGAGEVYHVADTSAAAELLVEHAKSGDLVLIKGSRAARMERVLDHPALRADNKLGQSDDVGRIDTASSSSPTAEAR
jgi:UDP-N-acetylmuramoyl-tripeptide--D-alanyl-D-alanine ligase